LSSGVDTTVRLNNIGLDEIQAACQASSPQFGLNGMSLVIVDPSSALTIDDTSCQAHTALKGVTASVLDVAFGPEGKFIAVSYADYSVRLWTVATGQVHSVYRASGAVTSLAFSPHGKWLIGTTGTGTVLARDAVADKLISSGATHMTKISGPAVATNGTVAIGGANGTLMLWDAKNGVAGTTFKGHTGTVNSVAFNSDGTLLASGSDDKTVRVWNTTTGQELYERTATSSVTNVAFSPDSTLLAFSTSEGFIEFLSLK
jgi:WD40 repeat protein